MRVRESWTCQSVLAGMHELDISVGIGTVSRRKWREIAMQAIRSRFCEYWLDELRDIICKAQPPADPLEYVNKLVTLG